MKVKVYLCIVAAGGIVAIILSFNKPYMGGVWLGQFTFFLLAFCILENIFVKEWRKKK